MDDTFTQNLVVFARLLHGAGLEISAEQVVDLARVLTLIGVTRREDVYCAARALFVRRREDLPVFDRAFELFFSIHGRPEQAVVDPTQKPAHRIFRPKNLQQLFEQDRAGKKEQNRRTGEEPEEGEEKQTYSPLETLRWKKFEDFTSEEIAMARRLIAQMDWRIGERRTRRRQPAQPGPEIDFAHLARSNLKYGGELFRLPARERRFKPRPLVVLADISGSMEPYTRMVLQLLHTLHHTGMQVQAFVFATRLTWITPDLKRRSIDAALARVTQHVQDWSGGTRIGEAIKAFNFRWARRVLRSGGIVLILSDGWDRGDLELLRDEMARLQRSCYRLIWLSPAALPPHPASSDSMALGLRVALPFVDNWMPVYNLVTLESLAQELAKLGATRPLRRQHPPVVVPTQTAELVHVNVDVPETGTSDYVRRTMVLRSTDGGTSVLYEENPGEHQRR
jgi:uncharacterized protein with von Willebrand factor type A (vWA) domain